LVSVLAAIFNVKQNLRQLSPNKENIPVSSPDPAVSSAFKQKTDIVEDPMAIKTISRGIPVYTRKVEGSPILEFKASVIINAPIAKAIALF